MGVAGCSQGLSNFSQIPLEMQGLRMGRQPFEMLTFGGRKCAGRELWESWKM